jgi:hypothetical protein
MIVPRTASPSALRKLTNGSICDFVCKVVFRKVGAGHLCRPMIVRIVRENGHNTRKIAERKQSAFPLTLLPIAQQNAENIILC